MLKELLSGKYRDKEDRRWFSDDYFDLIVWIGQNFVIKGFQLCYDKRGKERAITWLRDKGLSHEKIDDGEASPEKNRSPILLPDGQCPVQEVLERFEANSADIDTAVRSFVLSKIEEYKAVIKK
ncbi:MAG: hypothetical protein A2010_02210 [Nitrospirae bacterium GWD2_57_9]|nr:MAG: hypothetical protein A2010_02210 [Nitrospirae bacterium GWD2_57_9]OGW45146.1 MAG: hypothetical protein A2078_11905 [Nitrospirae bacterium GWC2_57_9]